MYDEATTAAATFQKQFLEDRVQVAREQADEVLKVAVETLQHLEDLADRYSHDRSSAVTEESVYFLNDAPLRAASRAVAELQEEQRRLDSFLNTYGHLI